MPKEPAGFASGLSRSVLDPLPDRPGLCPIRAAVSGRLVFRSILSDARDETIPGTDLGNMGRDGATR